MSEDPWLRLSVPDARNAVSAIRISETARWNFYWGRDSESRCLLILRHQCRAVPHLPKLKGIDILAEEGESETMASLVLRLLDSAQRDIFYRLCLDIVETASSGKSEQEALALIVARTWRWHHLLRGGSSGLLSAEEQLGLMGELHVLDTYLLGTLSSVAALDAWRGPLGAAKDFVVGTTAVEVKAIGRSERAQVEIHSAQQLDGTGLTALFLSVSVLGPAGVGGEEGLTVTDLAVRVRERLRPEGLELIERFAALLAAAGFRFEDDYSNYRWTGGERGIYRVEGSFPRLTSATLPPGITHLTYFVNLAECAGYLVTPEVLIGTLGGTGSAF